jgi:hypothetical protein
MDHRMIFLFSNWTETAIAVTFRLDALDLLGRRLPNRIGSSISVLDPGQALKLSLRPGCLLQLYVLSKPGVLSAIEPALLPATLAVTRAQSSTCVETATSVAASTVQTIGSFYSPQGLPVRASVVTVLGKLQVAPDLIFDTLEVETLTDIENWEFNIGG